jgi:hypothetical protein
MIARLPSEDGLAGSASPILGLRSGSTDCSTTSSGRARGNALSRGAVSLADQVGQEPIPQVEQLAGQVGGGAAAVELAVAEPVSAAVGEEEAGLEPTDEEVVVGFAEEAADVHAPERKPAQAERQTAGDVGEEVVRLVPLVPRPRINLRFYHGPLTGEHYYTELQEQDARSSISFRGAMDLAASAYEMSFEPGDMLCVEGADSPECYVIEVGRTAVTIGRKGAGMVSEGAVVGERGILLDTVRSATVTVGPLLDPSA